MTETCRRLEARLAELVETPDSGGTDAAEREALLRHAASCPVCGESLATYERTVELLRGLPGFAVPGDFVESVRERLRDEPSTPAGGGGSRRGPRRAAGALRGVWRMAAVFLLGGALGAVLVEWGLQRSTGPGIGDAELALRGEPHGPGAPEPPGRELRRAPSGGSPRPAELRGSSSEAEAGDEDGAPAGVQRREVAAELPPQESELERAAGGGSGRSFSAGAESAGTGGDASAGASTADGAGAESVLGTPARAPGERKARAGSRPRTVSEGTVSEGTEALDRARLERAGAPVEAEADAEPKPEDGARGRPAAPGVRGLRLVLEAPEPATRLRLLEAVLDEDLGAGGVVWRDAVSAPGDALVAFEVPAARLAELERRVHRLGVPVSRRPLAERALGRIAAARSPEPPESRSAAAPALEREPAERPVPESAQAEASRPSDTVRRLRRRTDGERGESVRALREELAETSQADELRGRDASPGGEGDASPKAEAGREEAGRWRTELSASAGTADGASTDAPRPERDATPAQPPREPGPPPEPRGAGRAPAAGHDGVEVAAPRGSARPPVERVRVEILLRGEG